MAIIELIVVSILIIIQIFYLIFIMNTASVRISGKFDLDDPRDYLYLIFAG